MKRLLCLDWIRGAFIMLVIIFHALSHLLFWNATLVTREEITLWVLIPFAPLILAGTWAPIFALISGAATAYVMCTLFGQQRAGLGSRGRMGALLRGVYWNSLMLFLCSLFHMALLHFRVNFNGSVRHSFLTGSIERGYLAKGDLDLLFFTDAVALVAMAGIIISTTLAILWRGDGFDRAKRTYATLSVMGLLWFGIAPLLHTLLDSAFFNAVTERRIGLSILLKFIIGPPHSTFPNAGFSLFGAVLGIALARREEWRFVRNYGFGFGGFFVTAGLLILAVWGVPLGPERIGTALPVQMHMVNLGLMLFTVTCLIKRFEYQDEKRRFALAQKSTGVRRFGLLGMTIYICESLLCAINVKWYLPIFEGGPLLWRYFGLFLFAGMQFALWYGILRLWERVNFKYSIEWWVVTIVGWLRGRRSHRLEVAEVLYRPVALAEK